MSLLKMLSQLLRRKEHDHTCHCGGLSHEHQTGDRGCFRIMVIPPDKLEGDRWHVGGKIITGYSLREQRGYHQHTCGCWSRHEGSDNSISA